MHRILRPTGAVIIRDGRDVIVKVKEITDQMKWKGILVVSDDDPKDMIMLLNNTDSIN